MLSLRLQQRLRLGLWLALPAAVLAAQAPATASGFCPDGFLGQCAPKNWYLSTPGNGSVKFDALDTAKVSLTSVDNNTGKKATVFMKIKALMDGLVSFDYQYVTKDKWGSEWDPFGYILNGSFKQLSPASSLKGFVATGSFGFEVNAGDKFGFYAKSLDSKFGPSFTHITNFSFAAIPTPTPDPTPIPPFTSSSGSPTPAEVPGPLPLLGLGAAFGFSRRLKARSRARSTTS